MPLVLLGLIVFIGIVIYALVQYGNSDDTDDRPVRVKHPHVFRRREDEPFDYEFDDEDGDGASGSSRSSGDGHTMYFPDDAEVEKRKRNIH